ncbi:MAG: methyltransferase domain-containing protein, partial [Alphaproteobacteria bacterium]|nr:methyltransferase domain-containing protein [Alphaproteobacteria bacterium]
HYARIADDILAELPERPAPVLDFGCGEALDAGRVAARCSRLYLCDAASALRAELAARFPAGTGVTVLSPEELDDIPDGSLALIVVNSVVQYLGREECGALFRRLAGKLAVAGRIVVADVIPPDTGFVADVMALLGTAHRHGFLLAALGGLATTFFSDYPRLRRSIGLTTWREADFIAMLAGCGLVAERRTRNFGFDRRRMAFIARHGR